MDVKPVPTNVAVAAGLVLWFVVPMPDGVTPDTWHLLGLFDGTTVGIVGKAMPIESMALLAITLEAATGVSNAKPGRLCHESAAHRHPGDGGWFVVEAAGLPVTNSRCTGA